MDKDDEAAESTEGWQGAPEATALVVVAVVGLVLREQLRDLIAWWWDTATGITDGLALGELVFFALGLFGGALVLLAALITLAKVFGFLRDLGQSFGTGWRRAGR